MAPGRTEGTQTATRPSAGGPPRAGGREGRLFEEVLERLGKSNRDRVSARTGGTKNGRDRRVLCGTVRRQSGQAAERRPAIGCEAADRRRRPAAGCGPGGAGKKKSRARGPARVDLVGMSGCSVLAPTGHCGQTSQTGAEEEHGGRLGDCRRGCLSFYSIGH